MIDSPSSNIGSQKASSPPKRSPAILFSPSAQSHPHYLSRFGLASRREPKDKLCSSSAAALKRSRRALFNEHVVPQLGCEEIKLSSDDEDEPVKTPEGSDSKKRDQQPAERGPPKWKFWKFNPEWNEEEALSNEKYPLNFGTIPTNGPLGVLKGPNTQRNLGNVGRSAGDQSDSDNPALDEESILFVRHYNDEDKLTEFPAPESMTMNRGAQRWREVHISDDEDDGEEANIDDITLTDLEDSEFDDFYLHVGSFNTDKPETVPENENEAK